MHVRSGLFPVIPTERVCVPKTEKKFEQKCDLILIFNTSPATRAQSESLRVSRKLSQNLKEWPETNRQTWLHNSIQLDLARKKSSNSYRAQKSSSNMKMNDARELLYWYDRTTTTPVLGPNGGPSLHAETRGWGQMKFDELLLFHYDAATRVPFRNNNNIGTLCSLFLDEWIAVLGGCSRVPPSRQWSCSSIHHHRPRRRRVALSFFSFPTLFGCCLVAYCCVQCDMTWTPERAYGPMWVSEGVDDWISKGRKFNLKTERKKNLTKSVCVCVYSNWWWPGTRGLGSIRPGP